MTESNKYQNIKKYISRKNKSISYKDKWYLGTLPKGILLILMGLLWIFESIWKIIKYIWKKIKSFFKDFIIWHLKIFW